MKKETNCLACRKNTKNNNPKIVRNRQNRLMIQSNYATCGSKKSRFIKEQQDTITKIQSTIIKYSILI